jgi:hypothetical protein
MEAWQVLYVCSINLFVLVKLTRAKTFGVNWRDRVLGRGRAVNEI